MFQMLLRVVGSIIFRYTLEEVNNVPKYEEIANILRERIRSKEYPPDSFCLIKWTWSKNLVRAG